MIEAGARIEICQEHGPSCQLDYGFKLMGQFDLRRAVLRPHGSGGRVRRAAVKGTMSYWWCVGLDEYSKITRAQAAQAVYRE